MINVATDCTSDLGPSDWRKMNRWQLELFAREGNAQQFEELYFLAYGEEWQQD
jgi:hypothetical protein